MVIFNPFFAELGVFTQSVLSSATDLSPHGRQHLVHLRPNEFHVGECGRSLAKGMSSVATAFVLFDEAASTASALEGMLVVTLPKAKESG